MKGRPADGLRALVLQHEIETPAGHIHEWLERSGADIEIHRIDLEPGREVDPRDYGLLVSLGSEYAAYDDGIEWIGAELELMQEATGADVPVLGVCFGGQLLARSLGGEAFRSHTPEIGWLPVRSRDAGLVGEGPWFQWHFDSFRVPDGAVLVADSPAGPQAFTAGRSLGTQFHPEVTPGIMDTWVKAYRHELDEHGVDPDGLLVETRRRSQQSRSSAWRLLDAYLERVARLARARARAR